MKKYVLFFSCVLIFAACLSKPKTAEIANEETVPDFNKFGNDLTQKAQQLLVSQLMTKIQEEGLVGAVGFCHMSADSLLASVPNDDVYLKIQRMSEKNRNPENTLATESDRKVNDLFKEKKDLAEYIITSQDEIWYYKAISVAMPTCLNCRGKASEMDATLVSKINHLYPNDKATEYALNDYRGMWKVVMKR